MNFPVWDERTVKFAQEHPELQQGKLINGQTTIQKILIFMLLSGLALGVATNAGLFKSITPKPSATSDR